MIDGNERLSEGLGQGFGISDADEQRADETGTLRDADGVKIGET